MPINIETQRAKILLSQVKDSTKEWMMNHTQEEITTNGGSIEFVNRALTLEHCTCMIWCSDNRKSVIDIYNLHCIIDQYDQMKAMSQIVKKSSSPMEVIEAFSPDRPGALMPSDFLAFFARDSHTRIKLNRAQRRAKKGKE
tara:strand:- start:191 stop:613 length:423 start_codon:yes stop_codon:yes gene_type:complete